MKLCLWCKHFYFDSGCPDWSDVTPGDDAEMNCLKGHWDIGRSANAENLRNSLEKAKDCQDWEPIPIWRENEQS